MEHDMILIRELYDFICKSEGIKKVSLLFKRVGCGGASCSFSGKKVLSIQIDMECICIGSAYALCHEVAHQILISREGNSTHNRQFKKEEKRLVSLYADCPIARKLIF